MKYYSTAHKNKLQTLKRTIICQRKILTKGDVPANQSASCRIELLPVRKYINYYQRYYCQIKRDTIVIHIYHQLKKNPLQFLNVINNITKVKKNIRQTTSAL